MSGEAAWRSGDGARKCERRCGAARRSPRARAVARRAAGAQARGAARSDPRRRGIADRAEHLSAARRAAAVTRAQPELRTSRIGKRAWPTLPYTRPFEKLTSQAL